MMVDMEESFIHLDTDFVVINDTMEVGDSELTSLKNNVSEQAAALQSCNAEVNRLRGEVSVKSEILAKKDAGIAHLQAEMAKHISTLARLEEEINKKNAAILEKNAELAAKESALAAKDVGLSCMEDELNRKNAALQEKDFELMEKVIALAEKDAGLSRIQSEFSCKSEEFERKDAELGSLKRAVAQKDFDVVRLESMVECDAKALAEKDAQIADKDAQIADKNNQIGFLRTELYSKAQILEQTQAQVRNLQVQMATMALAVVRDSPSTTSLGVPNSSCTSLVRKVSESTLLPKNNKALKIMVGFPLALALANAPSISSLARCTFPMKHSEYGSRFVYNPLNEGVPVTKKSFQKALLDKNINSGRLFSIQSDSIAAELRSISAAAAPYKPLRVRAQAGSTNSTTSTRALSTRAISTPAVATVDKSGRATLQKKFQSFRILSNDHVKGEKARGRYFNFNVAFVERILGRRLAKDGERLPLWHLMSGKISIAVLWRTRNGGSKGDGHGRWDDGSKLNHFQVDDELAILTTDLDRFDALTMTS